MRFTILLAILFTMISCGMGPVTRRTPLEAGPNRNGEHGLRPTQAKDFNPIRKKIALLAFFNESPFGGEDLAIQATEEFRREVSRTRDFIIDPGAAQILVNSKGIY